MISLLKVRKPPSWLSDLVVLGQDAFLESPEGLGQIEVPAMVVGGQITHQIDAAGID